MTIDDLCLTPTGSISGQVTLSSQSDHRGALVFLEGTSYSAYTDTTGDFTLSGVPVSNYQYTAMAQGYLANKGNAVVVTKSQTTNVNLIVLSSDGLQTDKPVAASLMKSTNEDATTDIILSASDPRVTV